MKTTLKCPHCLETHDIENENWETIVQIANDWEDFHVAGCIKNPLAQPDISSSSEEGNGGWPDQKWCMCTKLQSVFRDGFSTCSICGGKDAYGKSKHRPVDKQKTLIPI
jgi:hypothetical protein